MAPRSMTGFGRGEAAEGERVWVVEVRTVNHRYLDQRIVLPRMYSTLEDRIRRMVAAHQARGRVDVTLQLTGEAAQAPRLKVNSELARRYHDCLRQLKADLCIEAPVTLADMISLRDVISQEEQNPDYDREWALISRALENALNECRGMREQEGRSLKHDLVDRLRNFTACLDGLEEKIPEITDGRRRELEERIGRLLENVDLDPVRLAQEAAILADKADVTEEMVRLRSHIKQFLNFLDSTESVGRRLDFLMQEFLREVNTIASKISNGDVAHMAVEMKNEIEKLREQVQNIE